MSRRLRAFGSMMFWLVALVGCSSWSSVPPISQPYFVVNQTDVRSFHMLAKKQDSLVAKCAEHDSCDHVYFTRALIGLYESRETASKYFEKVIAIAPKGQLAGSSRLWLQLLQEYPAPNERSWIASVMTAPAISDGQVMLGQTSDRLVRDLLDREMMIQQLRTSKEADARAIDQLQRDLAEQERKVDILTGKRDQVKGPSDSPTVQSLQRQLFERDKKIDELSSQLEALKRIDQEMRDKVRPLRPPSTVAPPPAPEPTNP